MGASALVVVLGACSLVTSLNGLSGGTDLDGGETSETGSSSGVASSGSGSSGGGSSSGSGSSSGGGSSSGSPNPIDDAGDATNDASEDAGSPSHKPDATAPEDSGLKDAGTDATEHDSAPPPAFCASQNPTPLFCDDFDQGGALSAPWDQLPNTGGAEAFSNTNYVSSPYAMVVTVSPNTPVTSINVAGYKSLTAEQGVAGTATTSFEIRVNAADESSSSDAILGAIQLWNGSAYWDLELEVFYDSTTNDFMVSMSEDGTSYVQHFIAAHLPMATWTRVTLSIVLPTGSGGATTATMAFNGTSVASETVHVSTSDPVPEILIGTTFATPTAGGWSVAYDNVTFDER
jgi:hypothetical protein